MQGCPTIRVTRRFRTLDELKRYSESLWESIRRVRSDMFKRVEVEWVYLTHKNIVFVQYLTLDGLRIIKKATSSSTYETRVSLVSYDREQITPLPINDYSKQHDREAMIRITRAGKNLAFINREDVEIQSL